MSTINNSNSDKFEIIFSNIPQPKERTDKLNMEVFHNFTKSVTLPDLSIETSKTSFGNMVQTNVVQKYNENLGQLTIEFFVDEDFENYKTLFDWIHSIRSGCPTQGAFSVTDSKIDNVMIKMLDNQKRMTCMLSFTKCLLISLSSLNLAFGSSENLVFSAQFEFEDFTVKKTKKILNN